MCVGTSIGTITEPDCLGPCEPGTSVTLEGIVWHETEGGTTEEKMNRFGFCNKQLLGFFRRFGGERDVERKDVRGHATRLHAA